MDKSSLPQWAWLLLALLAAAIVASLVNFLLLYPLGMSQTYEVVTTIALMAPVVIYVGIWYDEERSYYWEHSRAKIAGDVAFTILGALAGAGTLLVLIVDLGLPRLARDVIAMIGGFVAAWVLFWWRNTDLHGGDGD